MRLNCRGLRVIQLRAFIQGRSIFQKIFIKHIKTLFLITADMIPDWSTIALYSWHKFASRCRWVGFAVLK